MFVDKCSNSGFTSVNFLFRTDIYQGYFIDIKLSPMNPNRQTSFKPMYYLQRPDSPKNSINHVQSTKNLSLTMSIGANQSPKNFFPAHRKAEQNGQVSAAQSNSNFPLGKADKLQMQMKNISKQNFYLKEENDYLKKELVRLRKDSIPENVRSSQKYSPKANQNLNDLRGTIKKESGEIRELKLKLDMVSKQCKMYEEMIDKMDERMKKLVNDQHKKVIQNDELREQLSKIDQLKEKTNSLMRLYNELQSKFNSDQLQWMKWKQNWLSEKEYYLNIIHQLQVVSQKHFS